MLVFILFFFFFQAEDGIRDLTVTGVQTCALPISGGASLGPRGRATAAAIDLALHPPAVGRADPRAPLDDDLRQLPPAGGAAGGRAERAGRERDRAGPPRQRRPGGTGRERGPAEEGRNGGPRGN